MNPDEYYEIQKLMNESFFVAHVHLMELFDNRGDLLVIACARMICDRAIAQGTSLEEVVNMMQAAYENSEERIKSLNDLINNDP